jgi:hypothetical protein
MVMLRTLKIFGKTVPAKFPILIKYTFSGTDKSFC